MSYEANRVKAQSMIRKKGEKFTLTKTSKDGEVTNHDLWAVRVGEAKKEDDRGVVIGDYEYLAENDLNTVPEKGNRLSLNGDSFVIRHVEELKPTDLTIMYTLTVDHG